MFSQSIGMKRSQLEAILGKGDYDKETNSLVYNGESVSKVYELNKRGIVIAIMNVMSYSSMSEAISAKNYIMTRFKKELKFKEVHKNILSNGIRKITFMITKQKDSHVLFIETR